ncbi:MAG: aspartate aminotransferase family protein [Endomicrobiia bacterium]
MISEHEKFFLKTYKRFNIIFEKGVGKYLFDTKGKKYLDFFCGISVCNLGHCDQKTVSVLEKQIKKLWHISNYFYHPKQTELAKLLVKKSFPSKVFFSNSGAESVECALKLARKFGSKTNRYEIITFKNSFHGRTLATLTATGQEKFHQNFAPLVEGFKYATLNNLDSVKKLVNNKTVAIIVEPVQGEGGVNPATKEFLHGLRTICDNNNMLLVFDEIQTGFGRTGEFFAFQHFGVKPDIICLAKSIANGLPLGATVVDEKFSEIFDFGDHGTTFGGNILSCTAGVEVVKSINKKLLSNVKMVGEHFLKRLNELKDKYNFIKEVRGVGLMVGVELMFDAKEVVEKCLEEGLVISVVQNNVLRFLPPLIINKKDVDECIRILDKVLRNY